jgi:NADH:ubiquinone oxidoreductase subunit E
MPQVETDAVAEILRRYDDRRASLIPVLQEVQAQYHYLPEPILRQISNRLNVPLPDVYHVATFYNCFSLEPVGRNLAQVCLGTACHVRGAPKVLDRVLQELKLAKAGTTQDCEFTVRAVRCIGCCGLAPVVRVNDNVHPHMTQAKVKGMLSKYRKQEARPVH